MKQKLQVLLLCGVVLMMFVGTYSLASSNIDIFDDAYMYEAGFADENGRFYFQSIDWDGDICYAYLTNQSVYTYKPGETPHQMCTLPGVPDNLAMIYDTLTEEETEQLYDSVTYIAANDGDLYGYNVYSGKYGTIDKDGIHWQNVCLDFSCLFNPDSFFPNGILQSIVTDQELFTFAFKNDDYGDMSLTIYGFDRATGKNRELTVEGLYGVCCGKTGELLCLRWENDAYRISTLNLQSGKVIDSDFALGDLAGNGIIGGLAYDPAKDTVCLASNGEIYRSVSGSVFAPIAQFSTNDLTPEVHAWLLTDGRYAILLDGLHIREEGAAIDQSLSIAGGVATEAMDVYSAAYPDVTVQFNDWTNAEDLSRLVTTQDSSIDIYIVKADSTFTAMKKKGYAASLDSSDIIGNAVSGMDEQIRAVIINGDGDIVAYPSELGIWFYGINEGYWNMLWPDRPLPETFDEVLDAWIEWEREDAQDYPGVGFVDVDFDYAYWVYSFVSAYVIQHDVDGLPDLNTAALRSVLEKLRQVYEIRLENGRSTSWDEPDTQIMVESETGPGYIFKMSIQSAMADMSATGLVTSDDYLYGVPKGQITVLPITFDETTVPQTSARMYVYVVNPYSEHLDEAIHFIECMTQVKADYMLYYALHPNENEPYPNSNYEKIRAACLEQKDTYESAIQRAKDANQEYNINMEYRVQFYEDWLNDESNQWLLKKETIDAFRQMVRGAPLNVHAESPYICDEGTSSYEIVMNACDKYADGNLTLDAFLEEISSKMRMISLEEE